MLLSRGTMRSPPIHLRLLHVAFVTSVAVTALCLFSWPMSYLRSVAVTRSSMSTTWQARMHEGRLWFSAATNGSAAAAPITVTLDELRAANPWPGTAARGVLNPATLPAQPFGMRASPAGRSASGAAYRAAQAKVKDETEAYAVRGAVRDDTILGIASFDRPGDFSLQIIPLWLPIACAAVFQAWWLAHRQRWRTRVAVGCCGHCGYDLRASPQRCPECGRETGFREVAALPARARPRQAAPVP
jgi:hypothetical protein